jgi:hypothetical protein
MIKRIGYVVGIVLAALIQVRLLPELDLERLLNLPATLLIVTASLDRRTLALSAATAAGLAMDIALLRPLGRSSLELLVGVLVASQIRGSGNPLLFRRIVAVAVGLIASNVTAFLLSGGDNGRPADAVAPFVINVVLGAALAWVGLRRRSRYQFDQSLRG